MSSYENGKRTRLGRIYNNMKKRCNNIRHESYKYYGAKGIKLCEEWNKNFDDFRDWSLSHGYDETKTIDRIDNSKGYFPENCRWSTPKEQGNNRRDNHEISYKGVTKTMTEWAEYLGIDYKTLSRRIYSGWSINKAFETPVEKKYSHKHG